MRKIALATTIAGILATSSFTHAAEVGEAQLGGLIGFANQTLDVDGDEIIDDNDVTIGVRLGFFVTENLALEAGYENFGEAEDSISGPGGVATFKADTDAVTLGVRVGGAVAQNIDLYGRVGVAFWNTDGKVTASTTTLSLNDSGSEDGEDPYLGAGVSYNLSPKAFVAAEYTMFLLESDDADLDVGRLAVIGGVRF